MVVVSEGVRKDLANYLGLLPEKLYIIENGCDIGDINKLAQEELNEEIAGLLYGRKVVMTAGRPSRAKGQWHLIRAFTKVPVQIPEALLVILGTGGLEKYLGELVKM